MYTNYLDAFNRVLVKMNHEPFNLALNIIVEAIKNETPIHIFGNGGSSATASHFVVDWKKGAGTILGVSAPVFCLTDNVPLLTAIANDISYEQVFSEMLQISAKTIDSCQ